MERIEDERGASSHGILPCFLLDIWRYVREARGVCTRVGEVAH